MVLSDANPQFNFSMVGGIWLVMLFYGSAGSPEGGAALDRVLAHRHLFDDIDAAFYPISADPDDRTMRGFRNTLPGIRYFWDFDRAVAQRYGVLKAGEVVPTAVLIDRRKRVVEVAPADRIDDLIARMQREIALEFDTPALQMAPVLTLPRVFDPELCRALIDYYGQIGGVRSGHMNEVEGRTVAVLNDRVKRRSDVTILDEELRRQVLTALSYRLVPAVAKFLGWEATRIERYIVSCYSAEEAGFFRAHRDNTTKGTAHRKFAVSINLNAEEYDGGELRFVEFGTRLYKPPTGGATVFSCSLLHEAMPVTRGERYACLPFLYDEAGRRIREANLQYLDRGEA